MPPSSSIGGYMPSANQSRCPLISNRFDFVMCGEFTNSYPAATWRSRE